MIVVLGHLPFSPDRQTQTQETRGREDINSCQMSRAKLAYWLLATGSRKSLANVNNFDIVGYLLSAKFAFCSFARDLRGIPNPVPAWARPQNERTNRH